MFIEINLPYFYRTSSGLQGSQDFLAPAPHTTHAPSSPTPEPPPTTLQAHTVTDSTPRPSGDAKTHPDTPSTPARKLG